MLEKDPFEYRIVALGRARSDEDVIGIGGIEGIVHVPHRFVQIGAYFDPVLVERVRVSVELFEKRLHFDFYDRIEFGGGVVVQINTFHCLSS